MDGIHVEYNSSGTYWSAVFDEDQCEEAGVDHDVRHAIVVCVEEDGRLTLSKGYVDGSPEGEAEKSLFQVFRKEIAQEILRDVRDGDDARYAAFIARLDGETAPAPRF
jgi:hypothetical protein